MNTPPAMPELKKIKALVIDADQRLNTPLFKALRAFGFAKVRQSFACAEAFAHLADLVPDLIFYSGQMPEMSLMEFTRRIRTSADAPYRYAVIIATGSLSAQVIEKARDAGVHDFLPDPGALPALTKVVRHALENPRGFIFGATYAGPDRRLNAVKWTAEERRVRRKPLVAPPYLAFFERACAELPPPGKILAMPMVNVADRPAIRRPTFIAKHPKLGLPEPGMAVTVALQPQVAQTPATPEPARKAPNAAAQILTAPKVGAKPNAPTPPAAEPARKAPAFDARAPGPVKAEPPPKTPATPADPVTAPDAQLPPAA
ncbi:MAG: response regulator, partial [Alphaproteobacteria bacterium]|nr:response regulator [Alphaproteobacteria bacterium]